MFEESGDLDRERWVLVVIAEAVDQRWRSFVEARAVGIDIYGQFRVIIGWPSLPIRSSFFEHRRLYVATKTH